MDPRIENLEATTFFGKRLTRRQIVHMQETVELFPNDSRRELARTLCENFNWHTPSGTYREQFCLRVLEELERLGILTLPERRETGGRRNAPARTEAGEPGEPINAPLRDLEPVTLEIAAGGRELAEWTELVDRYHPRGYRSPIGCHLAYFVLDGSGRRLGCLMFESAGALPVRDAWVGWDRRQRDAGLARVLRHSRFLVFPWVGVRNLASRSLSLAARRVADDWQRRWGVRPLLAETFVDPQEQEGSCYRAAGWTEIGATASRAPKDVYVLELEPDARATLRGERKGTERSVVFLIDPLRISRIVSCGIGCFFPRSSDIAGHSGTGCVSAACFPSRQLDGRSGDDPGVSRASLGGACHL